MTETCCTCSKPCKDPHPVKVAGKHLHKCKICKAKHTREVNESLRNITQDKVTWATTPSSIFRGYTLTGTYRDITCTKAYTKEEKEKARLSLESYLKEYITAEINLELARQRRRLLQVKKSRK